MPNPNHTIITGRSDSSPAGPGSPPPAGAGASQAPGGRPFWPSRSSLEYRLRQRNISARQKTRYQTRVEAIVQEMDRPCVLARHDIDEGNVEDALEAAIEDVTMRMTPLTPEERRNPQNNGYATPLTQDVTISWTGKVLAVIRATGGPPAVHRFFPFINLQR